MATEHLTGMHQDDRQLRGLSRSSSGSGDLVGCQGDGVEGILEPHENGCPVEK